MPVLKLEENGKFKSGTTPLCIIRNVGDVNEDIIALSASLSGFACVCGCVCRLISNIQKQNLIRLFEYDS